MHAVDLKSRHASAPVPRWGMRAGPFSVRFFDFSPLGSSGVMLRTFASTWPRYSPNLGLHWKPKPRSPIITLLTNVRGLRHDSCLDDAIDAWSLGKDPQVWNVVNIACHEALGPIT
jgi:hypothetical protein